MVDAALFHDPVHDGAADPAVIRHRETGEWWMFYTQRRASVEEPGVAWVHGSRIGVARSPDARVWRYVGTVRGLQLAEGPETHWAPEVIDDGGRYRMYLTVIDAIPDRWEGHPRRIVEYVSDDLEHWRFVGEIPLSSDRVIDACVARCPDGLWRLWYKDEADDSMTWAAVSDDLATWRVEGRVVGGRPHEGPNVFELDGWWWMLVDEWRGMGVYRSPDAVRWRRQGEPDDVILGEPGRRPGDETFGRHGDVVVDATGGTATLYYFTHPHWDGTELGPELGSEFGSSAAAAARRSAIFAAPLSVVDGALVCDRDAELRDAGCAG